MLGGDTSQLLRSFALSRLSFQKPLGELRAPAASPSTFLAPMAPKKAKGKAIAAAWTSSVPPAEECGPTIVGMRYSADVEDFRWAVASRHNEHGATSLPPARSGRHSSGL